MIRFFYTGMITLSIFNLYNCIPSQIPEKLKNDITVMRDTDFTFDPKNLPIIGKTTEDILNKMYPSGPTLAHTYLKPRKREIYKKSFEFDRVLQYKDSTTAKIEEPGMIQFKLEKSIGLTIFILNNTVVFYKIRHRIKNGHDEWIPGEFDQDDPKSPDWGLRTYPGIREDACIYWLQYPVEERNKHIGDRLDKYTEEDCKNEK